MEQNEQQYIVSARKYRPENFGTLIGQDNIARTLKNSILRGQLAHAYLFCGPRGVGKTTTARIFAKMINCSNPSADMEPCGVCESCRSFAEGRSYCIHELDAASKTGVDDMREILDGVRYKPTMARYKVYIIDEVHMLSNSAFNALLKTLEEPPKHIIFILATTEPHKVPATILSRCQRFDFRAVSQMDIEKRIKIIVEKEHISITEDAIKLIARSAEGGMRDALSLLDQAISYGGEEISSDDVHMVNGSVSNEAIMEIAKATIDCDNLASIKVIESLLEAGKEIPRIINDLMVFYRNMLLFKNVKDNKSDEPLYGNQAFIDLAKKISNKRLYFYLDILNDTLNSIKISNQKRAFLEMALIKMGDATELQQVLEYEKIKELECKCDSLRQDSNILTTHYKKQDNGFYKFTGCADKNEEKELKNLFDMLGFSALNFTDSRGQFQFYYLERLYDDIEIALNNDITLLNIATEPVKVSEVYNRLSGKEFVNEILDKPPVYDYKTKYDSLYGGANGYMQTKEQVLERIEKFVAAQNV